MTDKQRYQRAFSLLHASGRCMMEVRRMKQKKIWPVRRLISVCAAAALVAGMATAAYAADVGGIRRTIQIWIHGDQTSAVIDIQGGSYQLTYTDKEGRLQQMGGGGVAIDSDGEERPLTEEEILEQFDAPQVEYREDGSAWLYCRGEKLDITDRFTDGICYVQVNDGERTLYLTIEYQGGYTMSPHGYVNP